jgi:hypothetical protein
MNKTNDHYLFFNDRGSLFRYLAQRGILCSINADELIVHLLQPSGLYLSESFLTEVRKKGCLEVEDIVGYIVKEKVKLRGI